MARETHFPDVLDRWGPPGEKALSAFSGVCASAPHSAGIPGVSCRAPPGLIKDKGECPHKRQRLGLWGEKERLRADRGRESSDTARAQEGLQPPELTWVSMDPPL